jgi:hypothetical protein
MGQKRRLSGRWPATQSRPLAWREETGKIAPDESGKVEWSIAFEVNSQAGKND